MLVSGALCGLAGGIEYVGMARQLGTGFSQNWGFLGIPVALLSGLDPIMSLFSALLFGALFAGSENLARFTSAGPTLIYIVQAGAVLGVVALRAFRSRRAIQKQRANS
jgi:simple sugar transport system permease protein